MIKCEICGNDYENKNGFGKHLFLTHNIHTKEYYDKYLRKPGEGVCPVCGKETSFRAEWRYLKYCSYKCAHKNESWNLNKFHKTRSEFYKEHYELNKQKCIENKNKSTEKEAIEILNKNQITVDKIENLHNFYCQCNVCNTKFVIHKSKIFYLNRLNSKFCEVCFPYKPKLEDELFNYVKEIYKDETILHDRNIIKPKELDIYLPKLKLAFEFDGTYWHADPRFFNENDIIEITKRTAKEIWETDLNKIKLAENVGIKLYRIKEYDWLNNNEQIKNFIRSKINENSNNC